MKNGSTYEGEWKNCQRVLFFLIIICLKDGRGSHMWPDGSEYIGEWS